MKTIYLFVALLALASKWSLAQSPVLIKNMDTVTIDRYSNSSPGKGVRIGIYFYFPAQSNNGVELWRTDGTNAGTTLVRDLESLFPGSSSSPHLLTKVGDSLYFFKGTGLHLTKYVPATGKFTEPWVNGGDNYFLGSEVVSNGDDIYFVSSNGDGDGVELMRYNTSSENYVLYDINSGSGDSYPHSLTIQGSNLFFAASDGTNGTELWKLNLSTYAYSMVKDIASGSDSSNPHDLISYNGSLFFAANDGTNGDELWSSDGTSSGTNLYYDINSNSGDGSNPAHMVVFDQVLYFSADDGNDGIELWEADDNNSIVQEVADINSSGDSHPGLTGFINLGDSLLYFSADDGTDGIEPWVMDNVNLSPSEVSNINSIGDSNPRDWYNLGDTVIFVADDGSGWELWYSHNFSSSTGLIKDVQPITVSDTVKVFALFDGNIFFAADDSVHGIEPWKSNGISSATSLLKDINLGSAIDGAPQWFAVFNNAMYFNSKTNGDYWYSLYKTDGTNVGTTEIKHSSIADNFSTGPFKGLEMDSLLIFTGYTDTTGMELWKSDGTTAGTVPVKNISPGSTGSNPQNFIYYNYLVYFIADDGTHGQELWKTDGTPAGTTLVKDINSGSSSSGIVQLTVANNLIFFTADDGSHGVEPWVSDGTTSGTTLLKDVNTGSTGSSPQSLFSADSLIYFIANDGSHGNEVWTSDGTSSGTIMLKDINSGSGDGASGFGESPNGFASLGGYVYFSADSAGVGNKLWRTDGTSGNTHYFYNVNFPFSFSNVGSKIVFIALPATSTNGFHIWSTDGTSPGTNEIEDFLPGTCSYFFILTFPVHNGRVFYWLDDEISGQELWCSDGTSSGTQKFDIAPGAASSFPNNAQGLNPLIFSANDGTNTGFEPWALNLPIPLPVGMLDLKAQLQGNHALLKWQSMSSTENNQFAIQRSIDGQHYEDIGFVPGTASRSIEENLQFSDPEPLQGLSFYRIRRSAISGTVDYSNICKLSPEQTNRLSVFPNPAHDVLFIKMNREIKDGILTIRSMNGQLVSQQTVAGTNLLNVQIANLAPGMYQADVRDTDGYSAQFVFVKQ
ncbi:MAG: T9SS type A sorting domain-containing protein [Bacteroidetes bacterium]|nr:T9SS type A sorting domain-containing protein [Bacteroidota bacterium]